MWTYSNERLSLKHCTGWAVLWVPVDLLLTVSQVFKEGSFGMRLRACSQSLALALWSLPPFLYLPFQMWPWSPLEDFERQTRMRAYTLGNSSGLPQEDQFIHWIINSSPRFFPKDVLRVTDARSPLCWDCYGGLLDASLSDSHYLLSLQGMGYSYCKCDNVLQEDMSPFITTELAVTV